MNFVIDFPLQNNGFTISPTSCFLRYLHLPDDESLELDLRQCAVVILSHLDRLIEAFVVTSPAQVRFGLQKNRNK